jgi:hypothetical protein
MRMNQWSGQFQRHNEKVSVRVKLIKTKPKETQ